jgi:PKD domain-containing protein
MTGMLTASVLRRLRFACIAGALLAVGCGVDLPPAGPSSLPPHGVPAKIDATATPGVGANGGTATIVARVLDGYAVAVADVAVTFSADSGVLSVTTGKTDASGAVTSILVAPAGGVHVKATTGALQSSDLLVAVQPRTGTGTPTATPLPTPSPTPTPDPGTLTVKLTAVGDPTTQTAIFTVDPRNLSGGIRSVVWVFGDGATFTGVSTSAAHQYAAGTYTASVTLTDEGGRSASDSTGVVVSGPAAPTPSLSVTLSASPTSIDPITGTTTLTATASAQNGAAAATTYQFDCNGDGTIDHTTTAPTASTPCEATLFPATGSVTAKVTVTNGTNTTTATAPVTVRTVDITIGCAPPVKATVLASCNLTAKINGAVFTGEIGTVVWNFGDGANQTLSGQVAPHTWASAGTFTVDATVSLNAGGSTHNGATGHGSASVTVVTP